MSAIIKTPLEKDIYSFFLSLSNDTLYNFSHYPDANTKKEALRLSVTILKDKNQRIFGAFDGEKMVGFGILKFFSKKTRKQVCQLGIVISDLYQGMGYGKTLCERMTGWAKENDFKKIWLTVYNDNVKEIKIYKKLGFQIEGIFMYDEYFGDKPRHSLSMGLFFDRDPDEERRKIWESLSKTLALP